MNQHPFDETTESLWLHAYAGKEHGMMVVGSPSAMRALGEQLIAASSQSASGTENWPREIASPRVVGPYVDVPDFQFSFHLVGSGPLNEVAPLTRRTLNPLALIAVSCCAVVGAVTILRWIFEHGL
jgi:hypothetical protein